MPNATELANARTLPEETPSQPSRRGILGALGALAGVTLGVASTTALAEGVVSTAVAPPTDSIVGESPEFISIVERLGPLVLGHPDAIKEEEAARVRFAAEAPLPSKSSRRNIGVGGFDIVRKRATFDEKLEYMKKRASWACESPSRSTMPITNWSPIRSARRKGIATAKWRGSLGHTNAVSAPSRMR
jgi:hypothetical protein